MLEKKVQENVNDFNDFLNRYNNLKEGVEGIYFPKVRIKSNPKNIIGSILQSKLSRFPVQDRSFSDKEIIYFQDLFQVPIVEKEFFEEVFFLKKNF